MTQVSGGFNSPSKIPNAKAKGRRERGEPEFPPLPPPWTLVLNLAPPLPAEGRLLLPHPHCKGGGEGGSGLRAGAPAAVAPACFRRGGPRDAASLPLSVGPSHLGPAWRPGLCSAPPARGPAPARLGAARSPGPSARSPRPRPAGGRGAGVPAPHTRVPPAQPLPGPSAAPVPRALRPPSSRPRRPLRLPHSGPPPLPHHHPYRLLPPPPRAPVPTAAPPAPDLPARLNQA